MPPLFDTFVQGVPVGKYPAFLTSRIIVSSTARRTRGPPCGFPGL